MLRTGRRTRPDPTTFVMLEIFFFNSYNFLWALPSWKSLAAVHKMMEKITRINIIKICSSYRPCPVRRNIEKSTLGKVMQTDRRPLGSPPVLPHCSPGLSRPSCPVSGPALSRTHSLPPHTTGCSKGRGYPLSHGCLTRNQRAIRSGQKGSPSLSFPEIPVTYIHVCNKLTPSIICLIWITSAG